MHTVSLDEKTIYAYLPDNIKQHIHRFDIFNTIDSTNTYLLEQAKLNPIPKSLTHVCLAEQQMQGRGRFGKHWVSPPGHNIYLSLLHHFDKPASDLSGLSLAMGMACARALHQFGAADVKLKWPNDIYFNNKKLGGILIELESNKKHSCQVVTGIGMNIHLDPEHAAQSIQQPYTTLSTMLGTAIDRNDLISLLIKEIIYAQHAFTLHGFHHFLKDWHHYDALINQPIIVHDTNGQQKSAISQGITDKGELSVLLMPEKIKKTFNSVDVSIKLNNQDLL